MLKSIKTLGTLVSLLSLLAAGQATSTTFADDPEVLLAMDFESSGDGASVASRGGTVVDEPLGDLSSTLDGISEVESVGGNNHYRLDDSGLQNEYLGVEAPLADLVDHGAADVQAVVTPSQTTGGGTLAAAKPGELDWIGLVDFEPDGTFSIHGGATQHGYTAGHQYLIEMHIEWGMENATVDYAVTDLTEPEASFTSTGHTTSDLPTLSGIYFVTDADEEGSFAIDDVLVTR